MATAQSKLEVLVSLRDNLTGGLRGAERAIGNFASQTQASFKRITGAIFNIRTAFAGFAGAIALRELSQLVKGVANTGDELLKLSSRTGFTVEGLSELRHTADLAGIDFQELTTSLQFATRAIGEFRLSGKGGAGDALEILGADLKLLLLSGAKLEDLLPTIADRFRDLRGEEERAAVAQKLFGKSSAELADFLGKGSQALKEGAKDARALGRVWREEDAVAAEEFNDAVSRLGGSLLGLAEDAIKPLLPLLREVADEFTAFVIEKKPEFLEAFGRALIAVDGILPTVQESLSYITGIFRKLGVAIDSVTLGFKRLQLAASELSSVPESLLSKLPGDLGKSFELIKALQGAGVADLEREIAELKESIKGTGDATKDLAGTYGLLGQAGQKLIESAQGQKQALAAVGSQAERAGEQIEELAQRSQQLGASFQQSPLPRGVTPQDLVDQANAQFGVTGPPTAGPGARRRAPATTEFKDVVGQRFGGQPIYAEELSMAKELEKTQAGLSAGLADLRDAWGDSFSQMRGAVLELGDSLVNNITEGFVSIVNGTKSAKEAFKDMAKGILEELARVIIKLIVVRILSAALGGIGGAIGGAAGGLVSGLGASLAKGQHGGVFSKPTVISEKGQLEAAVPLPNNRKIPVELRGAGAGGGKTEVHYHINAVDSKSFDERWFEMAKRREKDVAMVTARGYQNNPSARSRYR